MRKTRKILLCLMIGLVFTSLFAVPAFAVTEAEVQQQVNTIGKEGVTGNIFVWFLCAIGFLKISQKIDSFMSSLGINVGNTGGSMLAEAMIAARGVAAVRSGGGHGGGGSRSFRRRTGNRHVERRSCRRCQPQFSEQCREKRYRQRRRRSRRQSL